MGATGGGTESAPEYSVDAPRSCSYATAATSKLLPHPFGWRVVINGGQGAGFAMRIAGVFVYSILTEGEPRRGFAGVRRQL